MGAMVKAVVPNFIYRGMEEAIIGKKGKLTFVGANEETFASLCES